ncbi:DnaA/Hda family protein [Wenyingzhuangia sp. chi5]|uniref:DnaA/Hda family protein n=1 Tax=Wenyingzhuangia gilva TaxID=3057677 RepID=A0ABT8VRS7_9FLAO|nr:DnaA/Hda family protein [Wenyingzhuangia sp. chi5]MDO3694659.1 DnaA/Hda family protein [Wenyingzhuangia sp. chi5]
MKRVTAKIFMEQLIFADLLGKDSQRGVSLTYAWLANQLGHFSLGFFPTIVFSLIFKKFETPIYYSIYVMIFWIIFETLNLTIPIFIKQKYCYFKPDWKHLIFDTITDLLYFSLGALGAAYLLTEDKMIGIITIVILLLLFYPFIYWYTLRIYQQYAFFPFQFRLSQWIGAIDDVEKNIILNFVNKKPQNQRNHLLIFGNVNEGKTNLGVAIANELALKKQSCTYITATKLYSLFYKNHENNDLIWNWKSCDYLIIDDINPDNLKHNKLITPKEFLSYVDRFTPKNTHNRNILKNKNVIWILGTNETKQREEWRMVLQTIGVAKTDIYSVDLSD